MYISSEHIEQWKRAGKAIFVSTEIAKKIGEHLDQLPWNPSGTGLDWEKIGGSRAALSELTEQQRINWLESTSLRNDAFLVFWFSPNQPCIACDFEFAISNIEQAYWKAPGKRYVFGASINHGNIEPVFDHFAEYDGADTIIASQRSYVANE
jgi:hypothetical protein